jgi:hypothetical protein
VIELRLLLAAGREPHPNEIDAEDDRRMTFALREGLAEFAGELGDDFPVVHEEEVGVEGAILCWFVDDDPTCWQRTGAMYRKQAIGQVRPSGMQAPPMGASLHSLWPDCRAACPGTTCDCFTVNVGDVDFFRDSSATPPGPAQQEYLPQVLLDLWETCTSRVNAAFGVNAADAINAGFDQWFTTTFLRLESDANFLDLKSTLDYSVVLTFSGNANTPPPVRDLLRRVTREVLERHGIDDNLAAFCSEDDLNCI